MVGVTGMFWGTALIDFRLHCLVGFGPGWWQHRTTSAVGLLLPSQEGFGKFCLRFWGGGTQLQQSTLADFSAPEGLIIQKELVNSLFPKVILLGQRLQIAGELKKICTSHTHRGTNSVETCKALNSEAFSISKIICKMQT